MDLAWREGRRSTQGRMPKKHQSALVAAALAACVVLHAGPRHFASEPVTAQTLPVTAPAPVRRPPKPLEAMTVIELKALLRQRGLKVSGRKAALVARLEASAPISEPGPMGARSGGPVGVPAVKTTPEASEASEGGWTEEDVRAWAASRVQMATALDDGSGGAADLSKEADLRLKEYFESFPEMRETLRAQQLHSIRECLLRRGRCLNADEMGLGKTLASLVVAQIYSEEWPILVVAPTAVVKNWVVEVKKWLPHLSREVQELNAQVLKRKDLQAMWNEKLIFVVSYDQIWRHKELGRRPDGSPYEVVILDEAHYIKNHNTARATVLLPICHEAKRCILLTGTPVQNHAGEVWTLMSALDPTIPDFDTFSQRYCDFKKHVDDDGTITQRPFGVKRSDELHRVFGSFLVRARKKDVLTDLAAKTKRMVDFRDKIEGKHAQRIMTMMRGSATTPMRLPSKIFCETAKAKAVPVTEYVQSLLEDSDPSCKIVVFGHHMVILDRLQKMLEQTGCRFVRLDGKVDASLRQTRISGFQEDPDVQVALVGMTACGQGISLTAAQKVVFAELYWVPAKLLQAEDRVHRKGQEQQVEIIYCVVSGKPFMDESMMRKIQEKERTANLITDGQELDTAFSPLVAQG